MTRPSAPDPPESDDSLNPVRSVLAALGEDLPDERSARLLEYRDLLAAENARFSLVAPGDIPRLVSRHFAECAALLRWVPPSPLRILDFGSGGGLPGIVLAILRPMATVILLERRRRKQVFLRLAANRLALPRARVAGGIGELSAELAPPFDRIVSRAVGRFEALLPDLAPLVTDEGLILLPKGTRGGQEFDALERWLPQLGLTLVERLHAPLTTTGEARIHGATFVFRKGR